MKTDEQLAVAASNGHSSAYDELVRRYQDKLLRFLVGRSASVADAEDAVQDTLVNAWRYIASYDTRWRFSTWIYRIALRNLARRLSPAGEPVDELVDEGNDPLSACIVRGEVENLWLTARRVLSPDAYSALWLRYAEDMSTKDVSLAMERSESWTKVTLMRARRKLEDEFNAQTAA